MRSTIFYLSAILLAGSASAKWADLAGQLPACAKQCIAEAQAVIDAGCGPLSTTSGSLKDELCLCQGASQPDNHVTACVPTKCTGADLLKAGTIGNAYLEYCKKLVADNASALPSGTNAPNAAPTDTPTDAPTDTSAGTHTPDHAVPSVTGAHTPSVSGAPQPTQGVNSTVSHSVSPTVSGETASSTKASSSIVSNSGAEPTGLPKAAALLAGAAAVVMFL